MGVLDDSLLFYNIIQQGSFNRAAKHLGISNGLISRRIAQLELNLGVTLIKRTTRQLSLTPEGELFWQHAQRIQQELNSALSLIQTSAEKPKGVIRISSPAYFSKRYLSPMLAKFLNNFTAIKVDLLVTNQQLDLIKDRLDLVIRGAGYTSDELLPDSSMQMKSLYKEKIRLYASPDYLAKQGEPKVITELAKHNIIHLSNAKAVNNHIIWSYYYKNKKHSLNIHPKFNSNDVECNLAACIEGYGIGRFTDLNVREALQQQQLRPILTQYDWGNYHLYAIYPKQEKLPKRSRLLLDFIHSQMLTL